jgi:hypothetical protein
MNIAICTPVHVGLTKDYVESLTTLLAFAGYDHDIDPLFTEGAIVEANRNALVWRAKAGYNEAIVWADADISWTPEAWHRLVNAGIANDGAIICAHVKADTGETFDRSLAFCWTPMSCFDKKAYWFKVLMDDETGHVEGEDFYFLRTQEEAGRQVLSVLLPGVKHKRLSL